jgi:hypothetical protein
MPSIQEILALASDPTPQQQPVDASELLQLLMKSERPSEVLPFPRNDAAGNPVCQYRMLVLSQAELDQARASADRHTREILKGKPTDEQSSAARAHAWKQIYDDAVCCEALCIAMREVKPVDGTDPPKYRPLFTSARQVQTLLTTDECSALFNALEAVQHRYGPTFRILTDEQTEAVIEQLVTGAGSYPLASLQPGELVQLVISIAFLCRNLRTGTGSPGLPSGADTTGTTPASPETSTPAQ